MSQNKNKGTGHSDSSLKPGSGTRRRGDAERKNASFQGTPPRSPRPRVPPNLGRIPMRSPLSATSASLRRHSALLDVDSDGLAIDSDPLAPHSGPARGRYGVPQRPRVPSHRAFNRSSPRFGPACGPFGGGKRSFRAAPTRSNRSRPAFRTALVDSKGPWNPFSRSRHPFRLGLTLPHGLSAIDRQQLFEYIAGFYNTQWIHSSIGHLSPVQFGRQF